MKIIPLALAVAAALLGGTAQAADVVTGANDLGTVVAPSSQLYGHAFNDTDPLTAGLQIPGVPVTLLPTDTFYDDYAFTVSGTGVSTAAVTIDLGSLLNIDNLQVRLYQGTLATTTTGVVNSGLMAAWSSRTLVASGSGTGDVQVIDPISLAAGNYMLEVRGNIVGASGGAYAGVLNLAAVPEPRGVVLGLAGLLGLAFVRRRT